jgi:uncharacterized protein
MKRLKFSKEEIIDMPTVEHFKIPADDVQRAQKFYKDVFDWSMRKWSHPDNPDQDFWYFDTVDEKGNKGIEGGMMKRQFPSHTVTNYITVSSVDAYTLSIEKAGGKIIIPKTEIKEMGYIVVFLDTENNMFGIYEELEK